MEEAHDLLELKELISRLGLKDDRRQSPRYNVSIAGNYHADQGKTGSAQGRCWLIDVSKEGISVKLSDSCVKAGSILHLMGGARKFRLLDRIWASGSGVSGQGDGQSPSAEVGHM